MDDGTIPERGSTEVSGLLDNATETDLTCSIQGPFAWRSGYQRSYDGRESKSVGQDAVAWHASSECFVLAVCDGVSNSFYGEIAAKFLANLLVEWLWSLNRDLTGAVELRAALKTTLEDAAANAQSLVEGTVLPASLPAIAREALDRKRHSGSQSTLTAARILVRNDGSAEVMAVRLGDSRIRIWADGVEDQELVGVPSSGEVWSTARGVVGGEAVVALRSFARPPSLRVI